MGSLATGNVSTRRRNSNAGDFIVMTTKEFLGFVDDVTDNDSGTKGVDHMFIVRVKYEALLNRA